MPTKDKLGRGLGAMFPHLSRDIGEKSTFLQFGIEDLSPNRFQPRKTFRDSEQKKLVASIREKGIIQPIVVRRVETGYEIIAGERRWRPDSRKSPSWCAMRPTPTWRKSP